MTIDSSTTTSTEHWVRPTAVAGTFYPGEPVALKAAIRHHLATTTVPAGAVPRAIVVPHAGYVYSGPIAASAYARLLPARSSIHRVVLLGPSHHVPMAGIALSSASAWNTPLGDVPVDHAAAALLHSMPWVTTDDAAHEREHGLEVQLPFLQTVLDDFMIVPLVVGAASTDEVSAVINRLWELPETLVVISTDLSHYHRYREAVRLDAYTASAIVSLRPDDIDGQDACGARPLRGMLHVAGDRQMTVEQLDLRNSGDTAGDHERVVGYGAFALT